MRNIYEEKRVDKLILTFSIPSILALIVEMLTSVIDTAFAGNIVGQGSNSLVAMGFISPLLAMFTAMQTLFAVSTSVMIAKYINDKENLNKHFLVGLTMSLIISLSTSLIVYVFMEDILTVLGANGIVMKLAKEYLSIHLISNVFSSIGYTLVSSIRALGFPKIEFVIILASVIANILFNTILTFGCSLGLKGIALGTLISEIICASIAIIWLVYKKSWVNNKKIAFKEFYSMSMSMFKIGIAQTLIQMLASCTGFFINGSLLSFGSKDYVATWNIIQSMYMLTIMPVVGISQGSQTILAYFGNTNNKSKTKKTIKISVAYCFIYGLVITSVIFLFGNNILSIFGVKNTIEELALNVMRIVFMTFPFSGMLYVNMTLLQVTEREVESVILALTRQVFLMIPLVIIFPIIFAKLKIGISPAISIFFSIPVADILSIIVAKILIRKNKI